MQVLPVSGWMLIGHAVGFTYRLPQNNTPVHFRPTQGQHSLLWTEICLWVCSLLKCLSVCVAFLSIEKHVLSWHSGLADKVQGSKRFASQAAPRSHIKMPGMPAVSTLGRKTLSLEFGENWPNNPPPRRTQTLFSLSSHFILVKYLGIKWLSTCSSTACPKLSLLPLLSVKCEHWDCSWSP